jgi:flavin-dependent dehydrogenase
MAPRRAPRDLLVVGGGPAGLATAIFSALEGLTVTLFEGRRFPVDKPCGEGLMPRGVELLSRMGVSVEGARPFHGIRYRDRHSVAEARFEKGPGYGIRRTALSRAMVERARQLGVEVLEATRVDSIESSSDRASVRVGNDLFDARWVVAADGLHGGTGAVAPARAFPRPSLSSAGARRARFGLRLHFRVRPWTSLVEVHWGDAGEAYVTPVGEEEVSVAFLWRRGASWQDMLARFPDLRSRLSGRDTTSKLQGAGPLRRRFGRVASGRIAVVGDRSGYVDAITGDGVALAFECARALSCSLAAGDDLESYVAAHRRATLRYRVAAETVLALSTFPRLRGRVIAALAANPDLFERLLSISADGAPWGSLGLGSVLRLAASARAAVIE